MHIWRATASIDFGVEFLPKAKEPWLARLGRTAQSVGLVFNVRDWRGNQEWRGGLMRLSYQIDFIWNSGYTSAATCECVHRGAEEY
jgi:hypothetical protein